MTFLKHPKHKDICYEIIKVLYSDAKRYKLKVIVWNMAFVESFILMSHKKLILPTEKFKEYERITTDQPPQCLRNLPWKYKGVNQWK